MSYTCWKPPRTSTDRKQVEKTRDLALKELEALKEKLEEENIYLKSEVCEARLFSDMIGTSNALRYVQTQVAQVASTASTVLIQGETGVGKELVARAIHNDSKSRSGKPFIKANCAAIPSNLVESELFGHERGAFTDAREQRKGRFELADTGTLFLDEISELSQDTQAKILSVLQEGEFERVGGTQTLKSDVRIIAATNRDLNAEVAAGRFRADLFYRINVYPITVPPLRKRREDIPLLVEHFVSQIGPDMGKKIDKIPQKVMEPAQGLRLAWEHTRTAECGRTLAYHKPEFNISACRLSQLKCTNRFLPLQIKRLVLTRSSSSISNISSMKPGGKLMGSAVLLKYCR